VITTDDLAANAVTTPKLGTNEASGLAKAWVNFNGTSTVAIRASYNVSSITDNGTGDYTVNFATAMVDANYALSGTTGNNGNQVDCHPVGFKDSTAAPTTTSARINVATRGSVNTDQQRVSVQVFR
jgi:hypothetical protein